MPSITVCGKIVSGVLLDCNNPIISGLGNRIWVFNRDDITFTFDATNPQLVTAIILAVGIYGYVFETINNDVSALYKMGQTSAGPRYEHEIDFKILANNQTIRQQIQSLAYGRFVIIVENLFRSGGATDSTFEIFGGQYGLMASSIERKSDDESTSGAHVVKFVNPLKVKQSTIPWVFLTTDVPTTRAAIYAQIQAPVGTKT